MASDSEFQDSVEKSREALRRSIAEGHDVAGPARRRAAETDSPEVLPERRIPPDLHPFFRGLLEALPEPGTDWPPPQREQWLETARNIFALLYSEPGENRDPILLRPRQPAATYPSEQRSA
jgi:hypothetical protein